MTLQTYRANYRVPMLLTRAIEDEIIALNEMKAFTTITEVAATCKRLEVEATIYNAKGDLCGWVHADGTHKMRFAK